MSANTMNLPPVFPGHQRRQAPQFHREAAGWDSCGSGINATPSPPHPPITKASPIRGEAGKDWGRPIAISSSGRQGEPQKPVDGRPCNYVSPDSTKGRARFARNGFPHIAMFIPHFQPNPPHLAFCRFAPAYLSIYLFLEREEGKEGEKARAGRSTVLKSVTKVYPRIFRRIHAFPWMVDKLETQCWRGFQRFDGGNPQSTTGNALGGAATAAKGFRHGH